MLIDKGEAFSILSAATWAFGVILYKRLGERLSPLQLNLRKNLVVLTMLVPVIAIVHGFAPPATPWPDVLIALLSGVIGIGIADTLYFRALNSLGAGRMGIVGNFFSPFVLVLSFAFLGERLSGLQFVGFGLVSIGVLIIHEPQVAAGVDRAALRRGLLLGVAAVLLMAVAIVLVKRVLERNELIWISGIRMLGGVGAMALLTLWASRGDTPAASLDRRGWLLLVAAAFIGQLVSMLLWLAGYKYTSASVASILNETASVFIVIGAWWLLKEPMSARRVIGVCFTMSGVACMLG